MCSTMSDPPTPLNEEWFRAVINKLQQVSSKIVPLGALEFASYCLSRHLFYGQEWNRLKGTCISISSQAETLYNKFHPGEKRGG